MAGRSYIRWVSTGLLSVVLLSAIGLYFRAYLVDVAATAIAQRSNVPIRSFEVADVGLNKLTLANIALGDGNGPTARKVEILWTGKTLASGQVRHVIVHAPKIAMTYADGRFSVDGLTMDLTGPAGPPRFERLDMIDAEIAMTTPWGAAAARGDGRIVSGPEGFAPARVDLAAAQMDFAGGILALDKLAFEPTKPLDTALKVDHVDLQALLALIDVSGLSGTGAISGSIPIHLDDTGVSIAEGRLAATAPGVVRYVGDALPKELANVDERTGHAIGLARDALADFHYTILKFELERAATGEGGLIAHIEGANPRVLDNQPFVLNISLEADFDTLAEILLDGYATAGQLLRNASQR